MSTLLIINLVIAAFWPILIRGYSLLDFIVGFVLGLILISFVEPDYGYRGLRAAYFAVSLIWQVILSSIEVAVAVVRPRSVFRQGVVAVPLTAEDPIEITTLASAITLTPGTVSVNLGRDIDGGRVLFVHVLLLDDADQLREKIKRRLEDPILMITRGRDYQP